MKPKERNPYTTRISALASLFVSPSCASMNTQVHALLCMHRRVAEISPTVGGESSARTYDRELEVMALNRKRNEERSVECDTTSEGGEEKTNVGEAAVLLVAHAHHALKCREGVYVHQKSNRDTHTHTKKGRRNERKKEKDLLSWLSSET